jgi:hypothetical protein
MPSIEIPQADFRVWHYHDYGTNWEETQVDVTFVLMFGEHKVIEKTYVVPRYDYDGNHLADCRDEFDQYVAERLSRLFT